MYAGLLGTYVVAHKHAIWPVLKAVRDELVRTLREGTSEAALERARTQLRAELVGGGGGPMEETGTLEGRLQALASYAGAMQCCPSMRALRGSGGAARVPNADSSTSTSTSTSSVGQGQGQGQTPLCLLSTQQLLALVSAVRAADVNEAARKLLAGKPALALVGDLAHAPALDDLTLLVLPPT